MALKDLPRPTLLRLVLPFAGLALLALLWSGFWAIARSIVSGEIDALIAREKAANRHFACPEKEISGYPFRIELRCEKPIAEVMDAGVPMRLTVSRIRAVAQIYRPSHIIIEADGPFEGTRQDRSGALVAEWKLAQLSFIGTPEKPERVSLAFDGLKLSDKDNDTLVLAAASEHAELHLRRRDEGIPRATLDVAFAARALAVTGFDRLGGPADIDTQASLVGFGNLTPQALKARLDAWKAAGGKAEGVGLKLVSPLAVVDMKGAVAFPRGVPDGTLEARMAGVEQLLTKAAHDGLLPKEVGQYAPMMNLLGKPVEVEGRKGFVAPLKFDNGVIFFGPLPVGAVPRLF